MTETKINRTTKAVVANAGLIILGVLAGVVIVLPLSQATAESPLTATGIATLCYVAAAAVGVRWLAWLFIPVAVLVSIFGDMLPFGPWWAVLAGVGALLLGIGLLRRKRATLAQAAAMVGYFGLGVLGLFVAPRLGLAIAGLALAAHAGWDWWHYRRDVVVARSFALWCIGLDLTAGGICLVLAATTS